MGCAKCNHKIISMEQTITLRRADGEPFYGTKTELAVDMAKLPYSTVCISPKGVIVGDSKSLRTKDGIWDVFSGKPTELDDPRYWTLQFATPDEETIYDFMFEMDGGKRTFRPARLLADLPEECKYLHEGFTCEIR